MTTIAATLRNIRWRKEREKPQPASAPSPKLLCGTALAWRWRALVPRAPESPGQHARRILEPGKVVAFAPAKR